jgi:teichuronic acid biosynthesis glycosyltransferase TuaG
MIKPTIVIPVFNQEKFIALAIESALNQTYGNCSIIVVDDGSTDGTPAILQKYEKCVRLVRQEKNYGTSIAWNTAIDIAESDYLIGLDSDDELLPNTVMELMMALEINPNADIIYSDYEFIDSSGRCIELVRNPNPFNPVEQLTFLHDHLGEMNNFLPFGHVRLYSRNKLLEVGGYDPKFLYAEDYDLTLRLAESGANFVHVSQVLYRYRWHQTNKGVVMRQEQILDVQKSFNDFLQRNLQS